MLLDLMGGTRIKLLPYSLRIEKIPTISRTQFLITAVTSLILIINIRYIYKDTDGEIVELRPPMMEVVSAKVGDTLTFEPVNIGGYMLPSNQNITIEEDRWEYDVVFEYQKLELTEMTDPTGRTELKHLNEGAATSHVGNTLVTRVGIDRSRHRNAMKNAN